MANAVLLESTSLLLLEDNSGLLLETTVGGVTTSFTYTIKDGTNATSTATVTVTIVDVAPAANAQNDGPMAVQTGNSLLADVLANDSPSDVTLDALVAPSPTKGTAVIESGKIRYSPFANSVGADSVGYRIRLAANSTTDTATLSVNIIQPPPDQPPGSSPFVQLYPMVIDNPGAKTIVRPNFNTNADNTYNVPGNTIYDFRGRVALQHEPNKQGFNPYRMASMASSSVVCGGKSHVTNQTYLDMTWAAAHGNVATGDNTPSSRTENCPAGALMQGFYFHGAMDAMVPDTANHAITYENIRVDTCKDDCIQNDNSCEFTIRNAYCQGHAFISERPGGTAPKGKVLTIRHCLVHMKRQPYNGDEKAFGGQPGADFGHDWSRCSGPYNGPSQRNNTFLPQTASQWYSHKWFFKADAISGTTSNMRLNIKDSLFRIDSMPVEGPTKCLFPTDGVYENLTVIWFGSTISGGPVSVWPSNMPQSKSQLASMGITVIDNENAGWTLWNDTEALWLTANGWNATSKTFVWNRQ